MPKRKRAPAPSRPRPLLTAEATPRLTFSEMTWPILEDRYGIQEARRQVLFTGSPLIDPSPILKGEMERARLARLPNESAKTYWLVHPVLAEVEALRRDQVASISEVLLEVSGVEGLCGFPDFVISAGVTSKIVPIVSIVEAKKDDIDAGLPQCVAELYASFLLNGQRPSRLYGCVTTGQAWQFVRFDAPDKRATVDIDLYFINEVPKLLGVFCHIVDVTLASLGPTGA